MSESIYEFNETDIGEAKSWISKLCKNPSSFTMSVPVNWLDTDMVFTRVIKQVEKLQKDLALTKEHLKAAMALTGWQEREIAKLEKDLALGEGLEEITSNSYIKLVTKNI